jgi:hypothetical protein
MEAWEGEGGHPGNGRDAMDPDRIGRNRPDAGRPGGRSADGVHVRCGRIPPSVRDSDLGGRRLQDLPRLCQRGRNGHDRFEDRAWTGLYLRSRGVHLLRTVRPGGARPLGYDSPSPPIGGFSSPLPSAMQGRRGRTRATRWSTGLSSRLRKPSARICPSASGQGRIGRWTGGASSRSFPSAGESTTGGGCPTPPVSDPPDPRGWSSRTPSTGTGRRPPGVPIVRIGSGWTRTPPFLAVSERSGGSLSSSTSPGRGGTVGGQICTRGSFWVESSASKTDGGTGSVQRPSTRRL